jgi:hypothetical protein
MVGLEALDVQSQCMMAQIQAPSPPVPRTQTAPELPGQVLDLLGQSTHRSNPVPCLLRVQTVPVIAVPLALRAASAGRATMHPAPRPAMHRR